ARIDERRAGAATWAYLAVLDDALLLSARQRTELRESIAQHAREGWWQPTHTGGRMHTALETLLSSVAGESLGGFMIPGSELSNSLTAPQLATLSDHEHSRTLEFWIAQQVAAKPAADAPGLFAGAQVARGRRVLRRGRPLEDLRRGLTQYVDERVDEIDAACTLTPSQCDKLRLAGRIDIDRLRERLSSAPPEKLAPDEELVVQKQQFQGAVEPLPLEIFRGVNSYFRRSLESRLLDDQKARLASADRERRDFQRQALVEAIVAGFEVAASLTADQYDALNAALNAELADASDSATLDWRLECLRRVSQLPEERLRPIFFDFQWPYVRERQEQLAAPAQLFGGRQLFNRAMVGPAAAGGGMF
ncbi:MAG: hypothetical protein ACREHD_19550, partial [Pirellulales bacterium]